MKTNPWTNKFKNSKREKIVGSFYDKRVIVE